MTDEVTQSLSGEGSPSDRQHRFGKFIILRKLGQGAFGVVFLAKDTELDRDVALKIPKAQGLDTPERRERFIREARAAAKIESPNICGVYEIGDVDGQYFIAMQLISGRTLAEVIRSKKKIAPLSAAKLIRKLAIALGEAHEMGVVHRDLKPANIMIDGKGQPVIMDFGLARLVDGSDPLTVQGQILGTPAYMSPEQARGESHAVDAASDVFSLGVMFYEMLCGQRPYTGSLKEIIGQLQDEEFSAASPDLFQPELDPELVKICQRSIIHDPSKRIRSMKELAALLTRYLTERLDSTTTAVESQTVNNQIASLVEGLATETRNQKQVVRRWTMAVIATALLLLVVGIGIFIRPPATRSIVLSPVDAEIRNIIKQDNIRVVIDDQEVAKDYLINGEPLELSVGTEHLVQIFRGDHLLRQQVFLVASDSESIGLELPPVDGGISDRKRMIAQWALDLGGQVIVRKSDGSVVQLQSTDPIGYEEFEFVGIDLHDCEQLTNGQLANFTEVNELESIDLSDNLQINDSGIAHLNHLTTLRSLDLSRTNVADLALVHLRQNAGLRSLLIAESKITDRGLTPLSKFKELESLDLTNTPVTSEGIAHLPKQMTNLNVTGLTLNENAWKRMSDFSNLQSLDATGTGINDNDVAKLISLKNLSHLILSETELTDLAVPTIAKFPSLKALSLRSTKIEAPQLSELASSSDLQELDLSATELSVDSLRQLAAFPGLVKLNLSDASVSAASLGTAIRQMTNLETLQLRNTNVNLDAILACPSPSLQHIDVVGTFVGSGDLEQMLKRWPQINLQHDPAQVRDSRLAVVRWIFSKGGTVTVRANDQSQSLHSADELPAEAEIVGVNLSDTDVTDASCEVLSSLSKLETASFSGTNVSGLVLDFLRNSKSQIREVDFQRTGFSDKHLKQLTDFETLETLDIRFTPATGSGFFDLDDSKIRWLSLGGVKGVEPNLEALRSLPALTHLAVHNTSLDLFTRDAIMAMQRLEYLRLPDATDAEQPRIALLKSLRNYDLSGSSVSDHSLESIASMPSLETLSLANTNVVAESIGKLQSAKRLRHVDLSGLVIGDASINAINRLQKLESLSVAKTVFDNRHLPIIRTMPNLKRADVTGTRVTSAAARMMKKERPLLDLKYEETQAFDELKKIADPEEREVMRRNLTHRRAANWVLEHGGNVVVIQDNGDRLPLTPQHRLPAGPFSVVGVSTPGTTTLNAFDDGAMKLLQGVETLESFVVVSEKITDAGIANLQGMPMLRRFDVAKSKLSDRAVSYLSASRNLRHFRVADSSMTGSTVQSLSQFPDIEYFGLPTVIDDEDQRKSIDQALASFKPRSKLSILELSFVPRASLLKLADLSRLKVFGLTNAVELNRQSISRLRRLRGVNQLVIRDTRIEQGSNRTDFSSLAALDHLLRLDLDGTNVTNLDLRAIANLSLLQELSLRNTLVDDSAVSFLAKLPNLRTLRVKGSRIDDLNALSRQMPNCNVNPE